MSRIGEESKMSNEQSMTYETLTTLTQYATMRTRNEETTMDLTVKTWLDQQPEPDTTAVSDARYFHRQYNRWAWQECGKNQNLFDWREGRSLKQFRPIWAAWFRAYQEEQGP